jgi:hypothetical protein
MVGPNYVIRVTLFVAFVLTLACVVWAALLA